MPEVKELQLTVVRSDAGGDDPHRETVTAPVTPNTTVLDLLEWAKAGPWPTLAFRYSCRSGVCGSCGVMVNGRPVLACETNAFGYLTSGLTVAPLARMPVKRDLVADVEGFITRLRQSLTWLVPGPQLPSGINQQTPAQLDEYRTFAQCVNCLLCYAACPVFDTDPLFIGPAALALAWRWDKDSRDHGQESRDETIAENEHGIFACTQDGSCTRVCPKGVDPKFAISQLQRSFLA